jgi:hypothetical protein
MDEYRRFYFYKPTIQLKSRQMSAQRPLVHSNEAVLLTPMFSWSSDVFHSNRWMQKFTAKRLRKYAHAYPRGYGFSVRNGAADQIYVSVEAVAFQNIVVGVRKKKFARVLRNRRNAEHDQAVAIYRSAQSSSDPGSADALIRNVFVGTRSQTEVKDSRVKAYFSARHRFAERMSHLANVSPPRARFVLNLVRSASRSTIR